MKETEIALRNDVVIVAEQKKEFKKAFSMPVRPGHSIFSFNQITGEIEIVKVDKVAEVDMKGQIEKKGNLYQKPGHLYLPALNKKNAEKKFQKFFQHMQSKNKSNEKSETESN